LRVGTASGLTAKHSPGRGAVAYSSEGCEDTFGLVGQSCTDVGQCGADHLDELATECGDHVRLCGMSGDVEADENLAGGATLDLECQRLKPGHQLGEAAAVIGPEAHS
jgi:hypothetical protein